MIANAKAHLPGHHHQATETHHETISNDPLHTKDSSYTKEVIKGDQPSHLIGKAPLHADTTTVVKEETLVGDQGMKNRSKDIYAGNSVPRPVSDKSTIPIAPPLPPQGLFADLQRDLQRNPIPPPIPPKVAAPNMLPSAPPMVQPTITRETVAKPTIMKETVLNQKKIEVQPIVHREREQTEVHQVYQPLKEREIKPTQVLNTTLADKVIPTVVHDQTAFRGQVAQQQFVATKEFAPLQTQTIEKPAIIEEHIRKNIVEEVQPVLYKETVVPTLIRETQPIYEKVVEAPVLLKETLPVHDLGIKMAQTSLNASHMESQGTQWNQGSTFNQGGSNLQGGQWTQGSDFNQGSSSLRQGTQWTQGSNFNQGTSNLNQASSSLNQGWNQAQYPPKSGLIQETVKTEANVTKRL